MIKQKIQERIENFKNSWNGRIKKIQNTALDPFQAKAIRKQFGEQKVNLYFLSESDYKTGDEAKEIIERIDSEIQDIQSSLEVELQVSQSKWRSLLWKNFAECFGSLCQATGKILKT